MHAEQRRLAGAVRADDADDAAGRQAERQVLEQHAVAERLADLVGLDDEIAEPRARRNVDLVRLVARLEFLRRELLEAREARLRFRAPRAGIRANPLELGLDRALPRDFLLFLEREALVLLLEPRAVVALPRNAVAAIELEDPARDVVEEIAVVRDRDDRARKFLEETLEPRDGLGVQMVRRLVEQQHVGVRQAAGGTARRGAARRPRASSRSRPTAAGAAHRPRSRACARAPSRRPRRWRPGACLAPRAACSSRRLRAARRTCR